MSALHLASAEPEKPSASVVYVTPEIAERWLAHNVKNRKFKERNIARFARDMANGRWQITGEAVKFDRSGNLLDGQNRLRAVIASGATVPLFVVRGLAPESQEVMDSGTPRSSRDALTLRGYSAAKDISPIAVALMAWKDNFYRHAMWQSSPIFTTSEITEYVVEHPELEEIARFAKPIQRSLPLPIAALGACVARFAEIDADAATDFYNRVHNLHTTGKGDPIATLLKRVTDARAIRTRLWVSTALYFQVRAWNAYRDGERLEKFQIGSDKAGWARIPEPK